MKRRHFIASGAATTTVLAERAAAQNTRRMYRIGSLHQSPINAPHHVAFYDELRVLGFVEVQNLAVDRDGYGLTLDQLSDHARKLVTASIDVMLCGGDAAIRAAQQAIGTLPIVALTDDIVGAGFAGSMAKPDKNITGVSILATELDGKRQEILIEAIPGIRRMAALADKTTTTAERANHCRNRRASRMLIFRSTGRLAPTT